MAKNKKIRVDFKKNRQKRTRDNDLTREIDAAGAHPDAQRSSERLSGKGDLTRRRTLIVSEDAAGNSRRQISPAGCLAGRVVSAIGLNCIVRAVDGVLYECTVRRVVRTMSRDSRNAVVTGDYVLFRATGGENEAGAPQGVIEAVEPRVGIVSRRHDNREHLLAANVDQAAIVASADEPPLKPGLIDRFIISCEKGEVTPLVCINKADLVAPHALDRLVTLYRHLGYTVLPTSVVDGRGLVELKRALAGRTTVFTGQSGVGKSSLLNAVCPVLELRTGGVSGGTTKGTHTTRRAVLLPLDPTNPAAGDVVDTPGVRQFQLWEVAAEEVEGYFVDVRHFVPGCRFPDCTHTHEEACAVKQAVDLGFIVDSRYESFLKIISDEPD